MKYDYIIVGFGVAGMTIAFQLKREGKSVLVIDGNTTKASHVAAGMYNPVVLKRFTLAWRATELLNYAKLFYKDLEAFLGVQTTIDIPVYRRFHDVEEQNRWFSAIDKPGLSAFLSPYIKSNTSNAISAPYKYGEVVGTGRVLIKGVYTTFKKKLIAEGAYVNEEVHFDHIKIEGDEVMVNSYTSSKVIFCEGYKMLENPYFNYLPLGTNRGAYIVFKSEDLQLDVAVKSHYFLLPLGNNTYKYGATYQNHIQIKEEPNPDYEKEVLVSQLDKLIDVPYEIVDFLAGVRPTVKDRKPLVGVHPKYENLIIFNGLGTRGVTQAPEASKRLFDYLERGIQLPEEININRYLEMYDQT